MRPCVYDDVILGAHFSDNTGKAFIFFGGAPMDSIADLILHGEVADDYFGWSVSSAGDVNSDGFDDVIVFVWSWCCLPDSRYAV